MVKGRKGARKRTHSEELGEGGDRTSEKGKRGEKGS